MEHDEKFFVHRVHNVISEKMFWIGKKLERFFLVNILQTKESTRLESFWVKATNELQITPGVSYELLLIDSEGRALYQKGSAKESVPVEPSKIFDAHNFWCDGDPFQSESGFNTPPDDHSDDEEHEDGVDDSGVVSGPPVQDS